MSKRIIFLYTDTNGLHDTNEHVSKKNLFMYARLVALHYEIGYRDNNKKFISQKKVDSIVKPRCMYITEESINIHGITNEMAFEKGLEIEDILNQFLNDIKDVSIIVSHNVDFHLKTIIAEFVRYNIRIDLTKFIIIDTISFYHKLSFPKLPVLYKELYPKNKKSRNNLNMITECFLKLYEQYEQI